MTISPCAMLITPITPKVMASPMAASSSTEPREMPYQTFCATCQAASVCSIDGGRGGRRRLDLAVGGRGGGLQDAQRIAVAALAHQGDRLELLRRRRVGGGEHDGGARLAHRALDARVLFGGQRLVEGRQRRGIAALEQGLGRARAAPWDRGSSG